MALIFTVTDAGRAALVNAAGNGTDAVLIATAGLSATAIVPDRTMTALPGQFKTLATLSGTDVADDIIHLIIRDESNAAFTLRSVGLYLADGTLFGVYGQAEPIIEKTAASLMLLEMNIQFADIAADSVTFGDANFLNPPATETTMGIAELATQAESDSGTDDKRIVTPKKMRTSVLAWLASWFADVWRASNDGSGSGLDADLLDGQHGSYYRDLGNATGKAPISVLPFLDGDEAVGWARMNASGDGDVGGSLRITTAGNNLTYYHDGVQVWSVSRYGNMSVTGNIAINGTATIGGNTAWHAGNDGAGSGCDADLLDGQHGAYYNALGNATGTLANGRLGGSYDGITQMTMTRIRLLSTTDASLESVNHALQVGPDSGACLLLDNNEIMCRNNGEPGPLYINNDGGLVEINGGKAWHAGNDGAGSGLDADLLDGLHGSAFAKVADFANSQANNGYVKLPGGLIIQWVNVVNGTSNAAPFVWPIPFPKAVFAAVPGSRQGLTFSGSQSVYLNNVTTTGGSLWANNGGNHSTTSCVIAIGN
ncbi:MAG TPA: hypothetical protein VNS79_03650 [Sphingobium sp.]|nr:hypothetical protein [Sphingobium sp.]